MADVGTGTTIAFGTSLFTADILSASGSGITRASVDTTHMGTTGAMESMPAALYESGDLEISFAFDPDSQPPITGAAETVTVTFPIPAGLINGATLIGTGFLTGWSWDSPLEEKMTASATLHWDGATDPAWTDAS